MAPIFLEPHMATLEKIVAYLGMKSGLWQIRPRHQYMKQILKTNSYRNKLLQVNKLQKVTFVFQFIR